MKSFFSIDSPIYKFMTALTNILVLSLCWLVGSILIISAGTSTIAAFDVALKMVDNEEGYIAKQFFKAFIDKNNIKNGIILELITLVCAYVLYLDFQLFDVAPNNPVAFLIFGVVATFVFVFSLLYAYPQAARYDNKLHIILRNSFRISMKFIGRSIFLVVAVGLEVCAFLWNTTMMFIGLIIGPACIIYTMAAVSKKIFLKLEKEAREYDGEED